MLFTCLKMFVNTPRRKSFETDEMHSKYTCCSLVFLIFFLSLQRTSITGSIFSHCRMPQMEIKPNFHRVIKLTINQGHQRKDNSSLIFQNKPSNSWEVKPHTKCCFFYLQCSTKFNSVWIFDNIDLKIIHVKQVFKNRCMGIRTATWKHEE